MLTLYVCKEELNKIHLFDPLLDKVQTDTDLSSTSELHGNFCDRGSEDPHEEIKTVKYPFRIEHEVATLHLVKEEINDQATKHNRSFNMYSLQRTHVILVLGIPIQFEEKHFFSTMESFHGAISSMRIIYNSKDKSECVKYSVAIYFNEESVAETFYQTFNGETIGPNEESMLLLFLSKVIFTDDKTYATIELLFETSFELPMCPICIEKLDGSITGIFFEAMNKVLHYEKADRWNKVRENCKVCSFLMNSRDNIECQQCGEKENVWICLICCNIGCGRYKLKHAYDHHDMTTHNFAIEMESQRIWDYMGDTYVHRLMRSKDFIVLNLPDSDQRETINNKFIHDRLDLLIWEYNYLLSNQLEEQRKFYDERIATKKQDYEGCAHIKSNEKIIADLKTVEENIKTKIEENEKETKSYEKKVKMTKDKISSLLKEIDQLVAFNKSLESNVAELSNQEKEEQKQQPDEEIEAEKAKLLQAQEKLALLFKELE